jgi:hypothetical protein
MVGIFSIFGKSDNPPNVYLKVRKIWCPPVWQGWYHHAYLEQQVNVFANPNAMILCSA